MHEDLLGYLLGALEPDEMQRVSDWLKDNPEGQRQLEQIERSLRPLEDGFEAIEAPSEDLIARTIDAIPETLPPADKPSVRLTQADLAGETGRGASRWTIMDSIGGLLSVATLLALLLPTIAAGRFEARKAACQDHFREFGTALIQYVLRDGQKRLPQVAESGPEAFAGMYAIRLADAGLMEDATLRWCPAADPPRLEIPSNSASISENTLVSLTSVPTVDSLQELSIDRLKEVQRLAGGDYAYSLGVVSESGYSSPRYEARTTFAVMSDAPLNGTRGLESGADVVFAHGRSGLNVLYEDGAVRFIRVESAGLDARSSAAQSCRGNGGRRQY